MFYISILKAKYYMTMLQESQMLTSAIPFSHVEFNANLIIRKLEKMV